MSNGTMDVLVCALALAASDIAVTDWEKRFASWIAINSSVLGAGIACWDVDNLAWTHDNFDAQKAFILRVIDMALNHHRWDIFGFGFEFKTSAAETALLGLRDFIDQYHIGFVPPDREAQFRYHDDCLQISDRCPNHGLYLNCMGCAIEYLDMAD